MKNKFYFSSQSEYLFCNRVVVSRITLFMMSSGLPENLLLQNLRMLLMLLMYEFAIFELFSCMILKACFTIELSSFEFR